ncbi:VOC family protein [Pseudomonas knackmussii]|uniref:VOC family protein n=1 Tax=Pseudomonas knackmussii TaxID=65741 RepID=A0ABY4KXH1_9PSED|nr:VOC family protein [Pseudomonas knackmussii]UPQ83947.1 VOC family protein [Pseudomonas knackmussii]
MSLYSKNTTSNLIPCLRYRDVPTALEWLCRVFDFEQQRVVEDSQFGVIHAQLSFGTGMLMLGPVADSEYGRQVRQPDEVGGISTQSIYVVVNSADALYTKAKAAGAEIVIELKDEDYGGRGFSCRDLEGHLWNFGTYDPWDEPVAEQNAPRGEG